MEEKANGGPLELLNPTPAAAGEQSRTELCAPGVGEQVVSVSTPTRKMLLSTL